MLGQLSHVRGFLTEGEGEFFPLRPSVHDSNVLIAWDRDIEGKKRRLKIVFSGPLELGGSREFIVNYESLPVPTGALKRALGNHKRVNQNRQNPERFAWKDKLFPTLKAAIRGLRYL